MIEFQTGLQDLTRTAAPANFWRRHPQLVLILSLCLGAGGTLLLLLAQTWGGGLLLLAALALACAQLWQQQHFDQQLARQRIDVEALDLAFGLAPAPMVLCTMDGLVVRNNHAFAELLSGGGIALPNGTDLRGQNLMLLLGPNVWEDLRPERSRLLSGDQDHLRFEREIQFDNGHRILTLVYVHLLRDAMGRPAVGMIQILDLTQQRDARRALAVSESRFRGIIENTGELTLVVDTKGRISYVNPRTAETLNQPRDELLGTSPLQWIHADSRDDFTSALRASFRNSRTPYSLPLIQLNLDSDCFVEMQLTGLTTTPGIEGTVVTARVITDKVHTQRLLADSRSRFSTIFHASPDAILIVRERDQRIIDFNSGFTRLLGYTRDEAIGQPADVLQLWDSRAERDQLLAQIDSQHGVLDYESRLTAKNGERIHTEVSVRRIDIDGEVCLLCVGRDVSKRRQAEVALRESEAKFTQIFNNSPDGIAIISMDNGRIMEVNDTLLSTIGLAHADVLRRRVHHLPLLVNQADIASMAEILAEQRHVNNVEVMLSNKQGEIIPAQISAALVEIHSRPSVICLVKDNRQQRDTELMLQRSEARFRSAFENAPIGMLLVNTEGFIFQANNFALEMLAVAEEELMGNHISRLVPAEERGSLKESMSRLLYRSLDVSRSERRMLCRNSLELWTNFHMAVQRNERDEPLYFIVQIADVTEMRQSQERMAQMAFYDSLTELANRRLFSNRLEQAIQHALRSNQCAALLYLDLDQFKRVNDTLGHEAGDELLREVGRRLSQCVRKEDTVARPGGDEFTILLYDISAPADAGRVAEKILEQLRLPVFLSGHQLVVTTSIGITIIPDDSVQPNVLTKNADLAMYRAKERGRNNYQYFSEDMNTEALSRLRTENELYIALAESQFALEFQPKVRLSDQKIVGAECLLRWQHPKRGVVMPDDFIRVAEESGAIVEIGNWIIYQACQVARQLSDQYEDKLQLAINISPRQFRDPNLVNTVRRSLREAGIDPGQIELEITETMLVDDTEASAIIIKRLHELGVAIAIDDFGTGYSSLSYLKRFPITTIKVDRTFVKDIPTNADDMAITGAVIAMARQLNLQVVAEGVESLAQLQFLHNQGCAYGQGFYFSRPLTLDKLRRALKPKLQVVGKREG